MRRRRLILALAVLAGTLVITQAPPAAAHSLIGGTTGHINVAEYTTNPGGNVYRLNAHLAVGVDHWNGCTSTTCTHQYVGRVHFHCLRNGSPWPGCRIDVRVAVQKLISGGVWQYQQSSYRDEESSNSSFFQDSPTFQSNLVTGGYNEAHKFRGAILEPQAVRFLLADDSEIVVDMDSAVSNAANL